MSQSNDAKPSREPGAASNVCSKLLLYLNPDLKSNTLTEVIEMGAQQANDNRDEGYHGSPQGMRVRSRDDPSRCSEGMTNVVLLSKLPTDVLISREDIARNALVECRIVDAVVKLSKLPGELLWLEISVDQSTARECSLAT